MSRGLSKLAVTATVGNLSVKRQRPKESTAFESSSFIGASKPVSLNTPIDDVVCWGLALETSNSQGGAACLFQNDQVVGAIDLGCERRSAQALIPEMKRLLRHHRIESKEVAWLGLSLGPGSFTGLRVGITLAKVFSYTTGAALVGCSTVEAVASQAHDGLPLEDSVARDMVVILDAQRRQFFVQRCRIVEGRVEMMGETKVADGEEVVRSMTTTTVLTGAGLPKLFKKWPELEERALKSEKWSPSAESVGRIGYQRCLAGQAIDPMELKPIYIRASAAEEANERQ